MKNMLNKGFTLIELVIVIVIIGILAAIAVPAYYDLSGDATDAAKAGFGGGVRSALAISIAEQRGYPTVAQLTTASGSGATAAGDGSGINYSLNGSTVKVQTYSDTGCGAATSNVTPGTTDIVKCVADPA